MKSATKPKKRTRVDAVKTQQRLMADALAGEMVPPAHVELPIEAVPFWISLTRARARILWNDSDLETAAELARCKLDIEQIRKEIRTEGNIIKNDKGTKIVNPKHYLLETINRRMMQLSRMLQVHAEATVGKARESTKVNKAAAEAKSKVTKIEKKDSEGLIPRMTH